MLKAFRNALVIPDLRAKLLVTIGLLAVYRLMAHIPTPGVDIEALRASGFGTGALGLLNFISGGNFEQFSIAAPENCSKLPPDMKRSEEHTSELKSRPQLVCRLLLEKKIGRQ